MNGRNRHFALREEPWDPALATTAIAEIARDALDRFDEGKFWPAHPQDQAEDGGTSLYMGAGGVIFALDSLHRAGAVTGACDFAPVLPRLLDANRAEFANGPYPQHASLLFGDLGLLLLCLRLAPTDATADVLYERAAANSKLPIIELMWGLPGSMLACVLAGQMTGEPRWGALFREQAVRLLADLEDTPDGPLWTQDLYGDRLRYLGPVHGFAGNMLALMRGWEWLADDQQALVARAVPRTLAGYAWHSDAGVTWDALARKDKAPAPVLCQHCHGAPGMVTTFADAPFRSPEAEALLVAGGEFTWRAGPLTKGSNLCHGTGGNGYAFLKLHRRTGDPVWLERARAFAMTAIAQCREARLAHGRGRYSLWTGDVGLAIYLWNCIRGEANFPTIDVL